MGKVTDTIKHLKAVRNNYAPGSEEHTALTTAIRSVIEWGNLNAEIDNIGLWGFEDVDQRFQLLNAIKAKMHTLIHKKLKEMGVR